MDSEVNSEEISEILKAGILLFLTSLLLISSVAAPQHYGLFDVMRMLELKLEQVLESPGGFAQRRLRDPFPGG